MTNSQDVSKDYTIEKSTVECYKIRHPSGMYWADITIDTKPGSRQGRIQIASDYGSYQYFWGACGPGFKEFLCKIDIHYAAGKFGADGWFDVDSTIKGMKKYLKEQWEFVSKSDRKDVIREIKEMADYIHEQEFIHVIWEQLAIMKLYDNSPPDIVRDITPQFKKFWNGPWQALLAEFKKETGNRNRMSESMEPKSLTEGKSGNEPTEFHVFVTSNKSYTHIIFGDSTHTACGIENEDVGKTNCRYPCSEIRETMNAEKFKTWFDEQKDVGGEYRFCERCRASFIKWITQTSPA